MKAATVSGNGRAEIVTKTLRPLKHGEAKLKMEFCGVCHSDLSAVRKSHERKGMTFGHEGVGIVTEVGDGVTSLKVGDRATCAWFYSACGSCTFCISGRENYCRDIKGAGQNLDGAMAEECIVIADYSVKVPEGLDPVEASSITCAGVTSYKAVKVAGVKPGEWLAIYGLGGLGNLAVQYAKNVFNARVIAIDINEQQLKFAKEMGAEIVINPRNENASKVIQDKVGGAHGAIVTAVAREAYDSAVECLRPLGKMVGISFPGGEVKVNIERLVMTGISVTSSLVGTRMDLMEAMEFVKMGMVKPKVELRKLEEINEILDEMEQGKFQGRMVVDFRK